MTTTKSGYTKGTWEVLIDEVTGKPKIVCINGTVALVFDKIYSTTS